LHIADRGDSATRLARGFGSLGKRLVLGALSIKRALGVVGVLVRGLPVVLNVGMLVGLEVVLANPAPRPRALVALDAVAPVATDNPKTTETRNRKVVDELFVCLSLRVARTVVPLLVALLAVVVLTEPTLDLGSVVVTDTLGRLLAK
jgi:hypothetical protein